MIALRAVAAVAAPERRMRLVSAKLAFSIQCGKVLGPGGEGGWGVSEGGMWVGGNCTAAAAKAQVRACSRLARTRNISGASRADGRGLLPSGGAELCPARRLR